MYKNNYILIDFYTQQNEITRINIDFMKPYDNNIL